MKEIAIRDSGMLYFGSLLLKQHDKIKTHYEMRTNVYEPISRMFGIQSIVANRRISANAHALELFYDVTFPIELLKTSSRGDIDAESPKNKEKPPPNIPPERKDGPKRHEENAESGEEGEKAIVAWTRHVLKEDAYLCEDFVGYDIYVKNPVRRIEVKTMKDKNNEIYITKNEYEKAHLLEENHWFYVLIYDKKKPKPNTAQLYAFKDLLGLLNLRDKQEELFTPHSKSCTESDIKYNPTYDSFKICLRESIFKEADPPEVLSDIESLLKIYQEQESEKTEASAVLLPVS